MLYCKEHMTRIAQFVLALILGLALLTWAASSAVQATARGWFERDIHARLRLVLIGMRQSLANAWYGEPEDLQNQLRDLVRDERVMGVSLTTPSQEQEDRMQSMRSLLRQFNVYRWARKMLVDAAHLRNRERVAGRLAEDPVLGAAG